MGTSMKDFKDKVEKELEKANYFMIQENLLDAISVYQCVVGDLLKKIGGLQSEDSSEEKCKKAALSCILEVKPCPTLHSFVGQTNFLGDIGDRILLPVKHPEAFEKRKMTSLYLLYGLPGNGKSFAARSIASFATFHAAATIFLINASDIAKKWFGESEAIFREIFVIARASKFAVIIIDEADELLGDKKQESEVISRLRTSFQREVDGVKEGRPNFVIIATTNKPWSLEKAAWSRFPKRYYFGMPTAEERKLIFQNELHDTNYKFTNKQWRKLGSLSNNFSGRDIRTAVEETWKSHVKRHRAQFSSTPINFQRLERYVKLTRPTVEDRAKDDMATFLVKNDC